MLEADGVLGVTVVLGEKGYVRDRCDTLGGLGLVAHAGWVLVEHANGKQNVHRISR